MQVSVLPGSGGLALQAFLVLPSLNTAYTGSPTASWRTSPSGISQLLCCCWPQVAHIEDAPGRSGSAFMVTKSASPKDDPTHSVNQKLVGCFCDFFGSVGSEMSASGLSLPCDLPEPTGALITEEVSDVLVADPLMVPDSATAQNRARPMRKQLLLSFLPTRPRYPPFSPHAQASGS